MIQWLLRRLGLGPIMDSFPSQEELDAMLAELLPELDSEQ